MTLRRNLNLKVKGVCMHALQLVRVYMCVCGLAPCTIQLPLISRSCIICTVPEQTDAKTSTCMDQYIMSLNPMHKYAYIMYCMVHYQSASPMTIQRIIHYIHIANHTMAVSDSTSTACERHISLHICPQQHVLQTHTHTELQAAARGSNNT